MFDKKYSKVLIFGLLAALLPLMAVAITSPTERVRTAVDEVLGVVVDKSKTRTERVELIKHTIGTYFDFRSMSQSILATNWKRASKEEQNRFVTFFSEYIENSYLGTIESYSGQEIRYVGEKIRGDRAVVDTIVVTEKADVPVSYKMRLNDGEWYAYDVVIEGVSLVSNYRSTYSAMIQQEGMDNLLNDLESKIKTYKKNKGSMASEVAQP